MKLLKNKKNTDCRHTLKIRQSEQIKYWILDNLVKKTHSTIKRRKRKKDKKNLKKVKYINSKVKTL